MAVVPLPLWPTRLCSEAQRRLRIAELDEVLLFPPLIHVFSTCILSCSVSNTHRLPLISTQPAPAELFALRCCVCSGETHLFLSFLSSFTPQPGVSEGEHLIKSFVFSHTISLSSLTHCLALHQISDPITDNHTFVFCQLGKFQLLYPSSTHLSCTDKFTNA